MVAFAYSLVVCLVLTGIGWSVVWRLDAADKLSGGERAAVAFLVGCFAVYFGVFAIGAVRLDGTSMWSLAGILAVAALPGLRRVPWPVLAANAKAEAQVATGSPWIAVLWLTLIVVSLSSVLQGLAPPNDYDSLMYHLSLPQYDIEMGRIGDIAWDRGLPHALFPALPSNISRFALATMDGRAAQVLHGLIGLTGGLGAAMLARRLSYERPVQLGSAIIFLTIRAVIWEMGTVEVDVPLATFAVVALVVYLAFRQTGRTGLAVLFGLMVGGGVLTKYHGFMVALAFAPLIVHDLFRRRVSWGPALVGPVTAAAVLVPHLVRNFQLTGNPIFPLFNYVFNPGAPALLDELRGGFGTGRGLIDFITGPWNLSVMPMQYFDGMILGAPIILALAPLLILDRARLGRWGPALSVALVYYVEWFYLVGQQVRFLLPAFPVFAAMAAGGVAAFWQATDSRRGLRAAFTGVILVLTVNQALFVGIYGAIRLPVAVGLMTPETYLGRTPTFNNAFFKTCGYIRDNLRPGERYFSLLQMHSFYCPQVQAVYKYFPDEARWWLTSYQSPEMPLSEFIARAEKADFRYFIISLRMENRRNLTSRKVVYDVSVSMERSVAQIHTVIKGLQPLVEGHFSAVYDGPEVIAGLKALLKKEP